MMRILRQKLGLIFTCGVMAFVICGVFLDLGEFEIPTMFWWLAFSWSLLSVVYGVVLHRVGKYVLKRCFEAVFVMWVIATLTFTMLRVLPGGPFDQEKALPPEVKANIEAKYGLSDSLPKQYQNFMVGLLHGDLGESYKYIGRSVSDIIKETLPSSMQLGFYSLLIAYIMGLPLGIFAASRHNSFWDSFAMLFAISGVSLPSFMVGPIFVMVFSFGIPFAGLRGLLPPALWDTPWHYILPVLTLGIRPAGVIARLVRSSVLEVIHSDFVRTAHAKGVAPRWVLYKHVLRNSLIPLLTISGPLVAGVLSGSFVIEILFAVPGMGKHLVQSVTNRDYPLIMGLTLLYSVMLIVANLAVDILYTIVDPRIELE